MAQTLSEIGKLTEAVLIDLAIDKEEMAIRTIIQQNNPQLFRIARAIVKDDGEAEDVMQEAYLRAFSSLHTFRAEASLGTWLARIVVNESLQRLRRKVEKPLEVEFPSSDQPANVIPFPMSQSQPIDPERNVAQQQIIKLVERAIDELPDEFRTVLVARVIEDLSVEETAKLLGLRPETVKTRLFRARGLLKKAVSDQVDPLLVNVFPFAGVRCRKLSDAVVERLKQIR